MPTPCQRTVLHRGAKFDFELLAWTNENGKTVRREIVRHPGAVCILPILSDAPPSSDAGTNGPDARIVLISNFRPALEREIWELPAGTLEPPEPPEQCAARELLEETGYQASRIVPVAAFYTTPGMTDERMHAFAAYGLSEARQDLQEDERIRVSIKSVAEVFDLIDCGEMTDAKSMLTLLVAVRQGIIRAPGAKVL